ncbi:hypothetical protein PCANC_10752 [Puccinia coronata f. sp. avenae]|uniref:Ig-like domain-containing protein n=1 Tax=Puccinia coronata f. sp. avenae TaxID=200324 RepID=A0A2N5VSN9_9BASI|nr:hypothetical protein PCANC_10752 [Puccinia coronata f. sp. avenae]
MFLQAGILYKFWLLSATVMVGTLMAIANPVEATGPEKLAVGRGPLGTSSLTRRAPALITAQCTGGFGNLDPISKIPPNTVACMSGKRPVVCPSSTCSFRDEQYNMRPISWHDYRFVQCTQQFGNRLSGKRVYARSIWVTDDPQMIFIKGSEDFNGRTQQLYKCEVDQIRNGNSKTPCQSSTPFALFL